MLSNPADAEEVTVDVYNQVWRTAASFKNSRGSVTSWLVVLARSRAIDHIRSRTARERREEPIVDQAILPSGGDNPEEASSAGQLRHKVRRALAGLPTEHRRAVELAFFFGLSHSELAERLGLPLGTVKTRIRSSMIKLRESLAEYA
jgi:RNA polymerase sigma-70 factor (ECF subfamily)